ncbi:cation/calcium exchanger 5 isoform X1 [Amborella trichopoda]|uniref:cation/calcium exchanger 5 isoform X1 n=2 Tax=Amborella trichopoda TaxID=13333 RepID=UPI0009BED19D|nr:cation/calcium exchanger 5 isoform X1 [Amborella trichopoda]|eukprot:XP_020526842.1 cation/calcium exchanger 5 isoform X1 [Amborella trichopoda]
MASSFPLFLTPTLPLSLLLLLSLLPPSLQQPSPPSRSPPPPVDDCRSILLQPPSSRCSFARSHCHRSSSLFNYFTLHFCALNENLSLSIPLLASLVFFHFYFLIKTATLHFSALVTRMSSMLRLSPSMGGVTLLALGNGAPDVFASMAAWRSGQARTGLGATLSAGMFVSGFVVGVVALYSAPFELKPFPFVRDVFFYMAAATALFFVYLTGSVSLWQATGFVLFYFVFVGFVFWMDRRVAGEEEEGNGGFGGGGEVEDERMECGLPKRVNKLFDRERDFVIRSGGEIGDPEMCSMLSAILSKVSNLWEVPVSTLLRLTIPSSEPSEWSRFYTSANVALCPLVLLYACNSLIPLGYPIILALPLWSLVLLQSLSLALAHYTIFSKPPQNTPKAAVLIAFLMSIFWISLAAGELLDCLQAIGIVLKISPSLLGLTVLAWGNSVGDLVADVAVARAGQPAMAVAGCFAGPMFNMLIGLGGALTAHAVDVYPEECELKFHASIAVAFVFLFISLLGSILVVTWFRFWVPRFWGFCLVGLYVAFVVVSLVIARFFE